MKFTMAILLTCCAVLVYAAPTGAAHHPHTAWHLGKYDPGIHNVENGIFYAFCGHRYKYCYYGWQAWSVSDCESTHRTWAQNGQYLGLFQMGDHERAMFGYGSSPWEQSEGAYNYFRYSQKNYHGDGWHPWQCKP